MAPSVNLLAALMLICVPTFCHAHGRFLDPCSRISGYLCRLGTPVNYNDHEMNCGGRVVQWDQNGGKCGICGDPWPGQHPYERPNGSMVQHNVISETYLENQVIIARLQITVAHRGWHEFRICDVATSGGVEATQECLNKILLADEDGVTRFTKGTTEAGYYDYTLVLPEGLTCKQCVIQWKWKCGNDYGCFSDGTCCTGCGDRQEEFYACSDVTINPRDPRQTVPTQSSSVATSATTTPTTTSTATISTATTTTVVSSTQTTRTSSPSTTSVLLSTLSSTKSSPTTTTTATTTTARTTPPSTVTTTQTTTPAAVKVPVPGNSFQENRIKQHPGLRNVSSDNSIKYGGNTNANNGVISYRTTEDFMNMIIGSRPNISPKEASVPEPSQHGRETAEKLINDRICAMCASQRCLYNICHVSCPDAPPCDNAP